MESYNTIQALAKAASRIQATSLLDLFESEPDRTQSLTIELPEIYADFSRQKIDTQTIDLLCDFATERDVGGFMQQMTEGKIVNPSQNRAALHMALRAQSNDGIDPAIAKNIQIERARIKNFADGLANGQITGANQRRISHIVHIGIGGSELGPRLVYHALKRSAKAHIKARFVANMDPAQINDALSGLDPAATLILIVSKSFTTAETLANAKIARQWLCQHLGETAIQRQMFAITSTNEQAVKFGISENHIFAMQDGVGGRFSLWSSVGSSLIATLGTEVWKQFLDGAKSMDHHVLQAPARQNMPLLSALISFWNINFLNLPGRAIVPYASRLSELPLWAQQLMMESNGKQTKTDGSPAQFNATPLVFGDAGTNAQHAFFQAIHQAKTPIPVDLIGVLRDRENNPDQHRYLLANLLGQASALMAGQANADPQKQFLGNRPSTCILLDDLSPFALGSLLAFYEHETVILGHLCGLNPFDQWGVELGKQLAKRIDTRLRGKTELIMDVATEALLQKIQGKN